MSRIDILMATYNGEKYISAQIHSILYQSYSNWNLIIHDDGSTDKTVEIVKGFCKIDTRISLVEDNFKVQNAAIHFMYMLHFSNAQYICFCDQDDIWLDKKLETMFNTIQATNNAIPQVVFSDAYLLHDDSNLIDGKLLFVKPTKLKEILFTNGGIHGSASMFNAKMKECLDVKHTYVAMHDHLLTLIGCSFGQISYLNQKLFLYRQHQRNVTGNMNTSVFTRLKQAFGKSSHKYILSDKTIKGVKSFREVYFKNLALQDTFVLDNYIALIEYNTLRRFFTIVLHGYSLSHSRLHLWIKILTRQFVNIPQ